MTVVTELKISEEGLRYYTIVFKPESNKRFYQEFLSSLTGKERDDLLEYKVRSKSTGSCSNRTIKKGRYPALRFKNMCKNSDGKINPHNIRSNFDNQVLCRYGSSWVPIDENSKNAVWDVVCDGL